MDRHVVPALRRIGLRRFRHHHIESFYDQLLTRTRSGRPWRPKTVYEFHLVIGGALDEAVRRGLLSRSVALIARSPRLGAIQKTEAQSWTAEQLQQFLRAATGHRLFPLLWLAARRGPGHPVARPPPHPRDAPHQGGVPAKVVSERLGHANIAFTIQTYQHVLPGMQADAARTYERLTAPVPPATTNPGERRWNLRRNTA